MSEALHDLRRETNEAAVLLANMKDIIGDDADLIAATVEGETNLHEAIAAGLTRVMEVEALAETIATTMKRMGERKSRFEAQAEHIRTAILTAMEAGGIKKIEHAIGTASVMKVAAKAVITDESLLPSKFFKPQPPTIDRRAVLSALKDGETVSGAQLSNGGTTLSIR